MNKLTSLVCCAGLVIAFGSPVAAQEHAHLHHDGEHHNVIVHEAQCHTPVHHVASEHSFVSGIHCGHMHHSLHQQWQHHNSCCCPSHQIVSHQAHPHWGINGHETHYWHPHHIAGCHGHVIHAEHHATLHSPGEVHSHNAANVGESVGSTEEHAHYTTVTPEHEDHQKEPHQHESHEDEKDE